MRTLYQLAVLATVFMLCVAPPATAQEPPGQQDAVKSLQNKSVLTDEDRATLRAWVEERVQLIVAGEPRDAATAVKELRRRYAGTDGFKEAYATVSAEMIGSAYKQAQRDSAARLIAVLNTLNHQASYKLLIDALGDRRVPVRTTAAIGLRRLQKELVRAGGNVFAESIAALREAGKRETSPVALQLIYRAMDYTEVGANPPDPKANALALLELLEARGEQYGARSVKAEGADRPGLELAGKLSGQMDEQGRQRLIIASAKMLHYGVTQYTSELHKIRDKTSSPVQIALRNRMELFIAATEELLVKLTSPEEFRTVTAEMQEKPEGPKVTDMKIAMDKWADLLQERYQIDVHMPVTEPAKEGEADVEKEAPAP
ncbi:MAG: hypothetical protein ACE5I3_01935 [Phycisphaerae bacterium]